MPPDSNGTYVIVMKMKVSNGANFHSKCSENEEALLRFQASGTGQMEVVKYFVDSGKAQLDRDWGYQSSPLYLAIEQDQVFIEN